MNATLEKIDAIKQAVNVEVTAEEVNRAFDSVMNEMRKEVQIKGFRKGKVPDEMILSHFSKDLHAEAIKKVVSDSYPAALDSVGANPLGSPSIEPKAMCERDKPFSYKATFEIYPEIVAKNYEGLSLEREKVEATDEEVELELKRVQTMMTQLEPAPDGSIGPNMVGMVDFNGTADGVSFNGSSAENYVVDFGSGNLLKEFEAQIVGMKGGEQRTIEFDYPTDYFRKDIAGKKGKFTVKVKEVRKKVVPELNDDFAKEIGKYENLKAVKDDIKAKILELKETSEKNKLTTQAIDKIVEAHKDILVPEAIIEAELSNMVEQIRRRVESQGKKFEDLNIDPKEFVQANIEEATKRARGYMLIRAISEQEKVMATDDDLQAKIKQIAEQARQTLEKVQADFQQENNMEKLRAQLVFEKTLELVVAKAKVKEVKAKKEKK